MVLSTQVSRWYPVRRAATGLQSGSSGWSDRMCCLSSLTDQAFPEPSPSSCQGCLLPSIWWNLEVLLANLSFVQKSQIGIEPKATFRLRAEPRKGSCFLVFVFAPLKPSLSFAFSSSRPLLEWPQAFHSRGPRLASVGKCETFLGPYVS